MYEDIAKHIRAAALNGNKIAMFHFQVLKNAHLLHNEDPVIFCQRVGVPESYATEFRKMLALAHLMQQQGIKLGKG